MKTISIQNKWFFMVALLFVFVSSPSKAQSNSEKVGNILQVLLPATAYTTTFVLDDPEGRTEFYKSFATNVAVTYSLKYAIDKPRPEGNGGHAFPSGHTSVSFQSAAFIHKRYGLKYGIPAYIAASYVGWSRVDAKKHDVTDVAAGAAIGIISSYYFTKPYKGFTVTPSAGEHSVGITISKTW